MTLTEKWETCPRCDGQGGKLFTVTVAGHAPSCGGGESCERTCPVPYPEQEIEPCPVCVDGLVPPEGMIEAAARASLELIRERVAPAWPGAVPTWDEVAEGTREEHTAQARAALVAAKRWEREAAGE